MLTEVPFGALADRVSRRGALVAAGLLQALGYVAWIGAPGFTGFAAGFVLWGLGGSLASGAFNALLYDGLDAAGAADRYGRVVGRAEAAGPSSFRCRWRGSRASLFALGGYTLAGVVSVAVCLAAAAVAATLPDVRPQGVAATVRGTEERYLATLRAGLREVAVSAPVRTAIVAVAVLTAFDELEEYFPLLAASWGVRDDAIPLALLVVPLAGAAGAALGGRMVNAPAGVVAMIVACGALSLGAAGLAAGPAGIAGIAVFYGTGRVAQVVADARLQHRISGASRATVTSVSGLATELVGIALFGLWALGGLPLATLRFSRRRSPCRGCCR